MKVATLALLVLLLGAGGSAAQPRNDFLLVLDKRAGPYRYLTSFKKGVGDYPPAVAAFGRPSSVRDCWATWRAAGISVYFVNPERCTPQALASQPVLWYGMRLFDRRWHTTRGIHVGQPEAEVRRIYPDARLDRNTRPPQLVLVHHRIDEFDFTALAVTIGRDGRVATIEVPPQWIY